MGYRHVESQIVKPIAAVVLEGTVVTHTDPDLFIIGDWIAGVHEKLETLSKTHYILLVTPIAKTNRGASLLMSRLYEDGIPFDEIWMGNGLPHAEVRYDNGAQKL